MRHLAMMVALAFVCACGTETEEGSPSGEADAPDVGERDDAGTPGDVEMDTQDAAPDADDTAGDVPADLPSDSDPGDTETDATPDDDADDADTASDTTPDATADTPDASPGCTFSESFPANGPDWPPAWQTSGGVTVMDVVDGWGRLLPEKRQDPYSLARVSTPACDAVNAEVTARVRFTEAGTQGVGIYLRASGGWLHHTDPPGAGYALFLENFRNRRAGLWREVDGDEHEVLVPVDEPLPTGVDLLARFRVEQDGDVTLLRGKVWRADGPEPDAWDLEATDASPSLQNQPGQLVLDAYSSYLPRDDDTPADLLIDDIVVTPLP